MSLPLTTTTLTLDRPTNLTGDSAEELNFQTIATGIPGAVVFPTGSESVIQGDRERVDGKVEIEPQNFMIYRYDRFTDEQTGNVWSVSYARLRQGLGLDHWEIGVYAVAGIARGSGDQ